MAAFETEWLPIKNLIKEYGNLTFRDRREEYEKALESISGQYSEEQLERYKKELQQPTRDLRKAIEDYINRTATTEEPDEETLEEDHHSATLFVKYYQQGLE